MARLKLAIVLLLAAIVAAEPTLHNHPLIPGQGGDSATMAPQQTICAACAISAGGISLDPPAVSAPTTTIAYSLAALTVLAADRRPAIPLPSRAPPAL